MSAPMTDRPSVGDLRKAALDAGCGCDLMIGWICGVHEPVNALADRLERFTKALTAIAHHPAYDGSYCSDPDDCPNCVASVALRGDKT